MSSLPLRLGALILPEHRWSDAVRAWRLAEELGFDHAWTYDHLTWRGHRDNAWFGAVPTLTAAAMVTTRLRLGTLVASPNFRHPLTFAKDLIALDDISDGRITAGIGAGSTGWDATMFGDPPWSAGERSERFAEFVELTDRLLREQAVDHQGRYYSVSGARTYPGCLQQPRVPLAIAASAPRGMLVAARYGEMWVTTGERDTAGPVPAHQGAAGVARQLELLQAACASTGRDLDRIDRLVLTGPILDPGLRSPDEFEDTIGHYSEAGATDLVVHWPRDDEPYRADKRVFEDIFTKLAAPPQRIMEPGAD